MASTSAEQYFEGLDDGALRKRKRLILAGFVAVATLLFFFAKSTLPSIRSEFVGSWSAGPTSRSYLQLRPDGTYSSRLRVDMYSANVGSWFLSEGTWRASHDVLYLTPKDLKPEGIIPNMSTFKTLRDNMLEHEQRLRVQWNAPNSINANEVEGEPLIKGAKIP